MNDQDEPHTMTTFRASMKRETAIEILAGLGLDTQPPISHTVVVTALRSLTAAAKADLIQFLQGSPDKTRRQIANLKQELIRHSDLLASARETAWDEGYRVGKGDGMKGVKTGRMFQNPYRETPDETTQPEPKKPNDH